MKTHSVIAALPLVAALFSGCVGVDVSRPPSPRSYEVATGKYTEIIKAARGLNEVNRNNLLIQIASKPDLTPADRNLLVQESAGMDEVHRMRVLNALAGTEERTDL